MKDLSKEQLEALERFRSEKDKEGSISNAFFGLLAQADAGLVKVFEDRAAVMLHAGETIGKEFARADLDPAEKARFKRQLETIVTKMNSQFNKTTTGKGEE